MPQPLTRSLRRLRRVALLSVVVLSLPAPSQAQQGQGTQSVSEVLSFLITTQAVDTGDAARDRAAAEATQETLSRALMAALSTLPLTSSSSGFVYRFNPTLGTLERASESFGPYFVERASPLGAGHASFALTWRRTTFDRLDGFELDNGGMVTTSNQFQDEATPFDVETLALRITAHTFTFGASLGVTKFFDVAVAVPVVSLQLEGRRVDTYRGTRFQQASATASATGLADVLLRGRITLVSGPRGGVAVGGDLRLPTGSTENLTGTGDYGKRAFVVASTSEGRVSAHLNAGLNRGGIADGFDFAAAVSASAAPRVTLLAEFLGRRLDNVGRITQVVAPHPTVAGVSTVRLLPEGSTTTALGSFGVKWNLANAWLLSASMLVPLNDTGLTGRFSPVIALEYAPR